MADLLQSLMEQDLGFLQIIADSWHVESPVMDSPQERAALVRRMLEPVTFTRMVAELPEELFRRAAPDFTRPAVHGRSGDPGA